MIKYEKQDKEWVNKRKNTEKQNNIILTHKRVNDFQVRNRFSALLLFNRFFKYRKWLTF